MRELQLVSVTASRRPLVLAERGAGFGRNVMASFDMFGCLRSPHEHMTSLCFQVSSFSIAIFLPWTMLISTRVCSNCELYRTCDGA
jgi:hypothetical protein